MTQFQGGTKKINLIVLESYFLAVDLKLDKLVTLNSDDLELWSWLAGLSWILFIHSNNFDHKGSIGFGQILKKIL